MPSTPEQSVVRFQIEQRYHAELFEFIELKPLSSNVGRRQFSFSVAQSTRPT
jgi:hypothetical protein